MDVETRWCVESIQILWCILSIQKLVLLCHMLHIVILRYRSSLLIKARVRERRYAMHLIIAVLLIVRRWSLMMNMWMEHACSFNVMMNVGLTRLAERLVCYIIHGIELLYILYLDIIIGWSAHKSINRTTSTVMLVFH